MKSPLFITGKWSLAPAAAIFAAMLCLFLLSACAAKKKTFDIPEGSAGIFAYGSLISQASLEQTLGNKYTGPAEPVHLTGYERVWACVRPFDGSGPRMKVFLKDGDERIPVAGTAELNILPNEKGRINGILYVLSPSELADLDKREWRYTRSDVTDRIEELRFRGGKVYAYEGQSGRSDETLPPRSAFILIQEFRDSVTAACDAVGKEFRADFDASTKPCEYRVVSYKDVIWEMEK